MRLHKVAHGHRWPQKFILAIIRLSTGKPALDVVRTLLYRPQFFGNHFNSLCQAILRGRSDWSVGERELFAAFVSKQNQCPF
jgi:hypothetical protein